MLDKCNSSGLLKTKIRWLYIAKVIVFLRALEITEIVNIAIVLNNVILFYLQILLSCFFVFVPITEVNFFLNFPILKP